jgi:hypothetical protein
VPQQRRQGYAPHGHGLRPVEGVVSRRGRRQHDRLHPRPMGDDAMDQALNPTRGRRVVRRNDEDAWRVRQIRAP